MNIYYWDLESWGADHPPVNADEIIDEANRLIDEYAEAHGEDTAEFSDRLWNYSARLWEDFCMTGSVGNVAAVYEER